MNIRQYGESDRDSCRALWGQLVQRHREIYKDPSIGGDDPGAEFDTHLEKVGAGHVWVAEADDKIIGLVSLIHSGEEAEVEPVIVSSEHRGKRIGAALVGRGTDIF